MNESSLEAEGGSVRWTCPFCLLLCDNLRVRASASGAILELADGECTSARIGLARFSGKPSGATALVDGQAVDLDDAVDAAVRMLAASSQPLFGGLGTEVAGARALYRLACATGAICDPAGGDALMQGVRSQQDRGGFTTTLAEVRTRADLIVCIGELPGDDAAEFFERCGVGERGLVPLRHVVLLGEGASDMARLAALGARPGVTTESIAPHGDLFSTVALLSTLLADRAVREVPPGLAALAARLRAARYAVTVGQTGRLPAHGALIVERIHQIVATLNATTRAAAMWLGGGNGAGTVNQVFTWLSGLPLRSRAGPSGLEHEPLCFDAKRLLADAAVDCLLWVSTFDAASAPPATALPLIVLGHPGLAASAARAGSVYIPVSTPGIGSSGHLFRTDGGAVLPLVPVYRDNLPALPDVLGRITQGLRPLRAETVP